MYKVLIGLFLILPGLQACSIDAVKPGNSTLTPSPTAANTPAPVTPASTPANANKPAAAATTPRGSDNRIQFQPGQNSATFSGGVIRGERKTYVLGAKRGQTMSVSITSPEDNAVFQIKDPSGKYLKNAGEEDDATGWDGTLAASGDYKIIVGGTRGNAGYELTLSIK